MDISSAHNRNRKGILNENIHLRTETGTCNVCAAPCSSCMHFNSDASPTESKIEDECSNESYGGKEINVFRCKACNDRQITASETSNLMSASSSHDSFSVNAESNSTRRSPDTCEDAEVLPKISERGLGEDQMVVSCSLSTQGAPNECSLKHSLSVIGQRSLKKHEQSQLDDHSDNLSGVSGIIDSMPSSRNRDSYLASASWQHPLKSEPPDSLCMQHMIGIRDSKERIEPSSSQCLGEPCESFLEAAESSLVAQATSAADEWKCTLPNVEDNNSTTVRNNSSTGALMKIHPCSEAETGDCENKLSIATKSLNIPKQAANTSSLPEAKPSQESECDQSGSEILEDDVKVCDICGDAGREELLAVCSRCSDGAEHTYCMRIMLDKLPEGDWLCEGCKLKEEGENDKSERTENFETSGKHESSTSLKVTSLNDNTHYNGTAFNPKLPLKLDVKAQEAEGSQLNGGRSPSLSTKRQLDNAEVSSKAKRQAIEAIVGSPGKRTHLSRESSFKNLDGGKSKSAQNSFTNNFLSQETPQRLTASSPNASRMAARLLSPRGPFSRSNTFNSTMSKPKTKELVDNLTLKQKLGKESASTDSRKEGTSRSLNKSMSFKATSLGNSNGTDLKAKIQSPNIPSLEDLRGFKPAKERRALEKGCSLKLNRSVISSSPTSASSKPFIKADSAHSGFTKGSESAIVSDGLSGAKRQTTSNGLCNFEEHNEDAKSKDSASLGGSKQVGSVGNRNLRCPKCNDTGHSAQFCASGNSRSSAVKASTPRNLREENQKINKWKSVVAAAMSRMGVKKNVNEVPDKTDELSTSSTDISSAAAVSKDRISSPSISFRNLPSLEVGHMSYYSGETRPWMKKMSQASALGRQLRNSAIPEHEYIWQGGCELRRNGGRDLEFFSGIQAHVSTHASPRVPEVVSRFPRILQLEEVPRFSSWPVQFQGKGATEDNIALYIFAKDSESYEKSYKTLVENLVNNDLALKGSLDGIDLLIYPSNQLPQQAHRWNRLFYLWAVFRERKEKGEEFLPATTQKQVCENTLEVELSVGDMDVDTKVAHGHVEEDRPSTSTEATETAKSVVPENATDLFSLHGDAESCYSKQPHLNGQSGCLVGKNERSSAGDSISLKNSSNSSLFHSGYPHRSTNQLGSGGGSASDTKSNTVDQKEVYRGPVCSNAAELQDLANRTNVESSADKGKAVADDSKDVSCSDTGLSSLMAREDLSSSSWKMLPVYSHIQQASGGSTDGGKFLEQGKEIIVDDKNCSQRAIQQDPSKTVERNWDLNFSRKRPSSNSLETAFEASGDMSRAFPVVASEEGIDCIQANGKREHKKKMKWHGELPFSDGAKDLFSSAIGNLGSSFLNVRQDQDQQFEGVSFTERSFFPVDFKPSSSASWHVVSSIEEDTTETDLPNLELALGTEKKSLKKEVLPLFLGLVDNKSSQKKVSDPCSNDRDDEASAALSLSLAFPSPQRKQTAKPVPRTEQRLPESRHVNTSLLLFGGFTNT